MSTTKLASGSCVAPDSNAKLFWQYRDPSSPAFDKRIFDDEWLKDEGLITNSPSAGRGGSFFLHIDTYQLVLRRYRRGGMARNVSENKYIWQGLARTRAWQEFAVLIQLETLGLPAPKPYACQVSREGAFYTATLVTHFLPGVTLAEKCCDVKLDEKTWRSIGHCIRQFHRAGVDHADLNAHNILIDDQWNVSLIDFDRAKITQPENNGTNTKNVKRLERSLIKISSSGPFNFDPGCWELLLAGYHS